MGTRQSCAKCGKSCYGRTCQVCSRKTRAESKRRHMRHCAECGAELSRNTRGDLCALHISRGSIQRLSSVLDEEAKVAPSLPRIPKVSGSCCIISDIHIPFHDPQTVARACKYSVLLGVRKLIIAGDLIHADIVSKYVGAGKLVELSSEMVSCGRVLRALEEVYDEIHIIPGNHDQRVEKRVARGMKTEGDLLKTVAAMLDVPEDPESVTMGVFEHFYSSPKVHLYPLTDLILNERWMVLHPGSCSRVSPQTERKMAGKFLMHAMGGHNHLWGIGFHESGKFFAVNLGHASDNSKFRYVRERISTFPETTGQKGFSFILCDDEVPTGRLLPVSMSEEYFDLERLYERFRKREG